jgi:malonyl-CoA O-methyltransferase
MQMPIKGQLDKPKIKGSFAQAATTYDNVADLQRKVGQSLLIKIIHSALSGTVLDVGCGTGFLTTQLLAIEKISQVIGLDIALPMLQATQQKTQAKNLLLLCADAESLPLAAETANHIVSNLALQWCEDLIGVFTDFKRILKPGGQVLFSTFGEQTLQELKGAWAAVDNYSHVNQFYTTAEITVFLQQAGFKDIEITSNCYLSQYESVFALMRELKAIGAHNVTNGRRKSMTGKAKLQTMVAEYEVLRSEGLIPATFEIITVRTRV